VKKTRQQVSCVFGQGTKGLSLTW